MAWPTVTAGQQGLASQYNALSQSIWQWQGAVGSNGFPLTIGASAAATTSANQSSPTLTFQSNYWNGTASTSDTFTIGSVVGSGSNAASNLTISHASGASGSGIVVNPQTTFNGGIFMASNLQMGSANLQFSGGFITGSVTVSASTTFTIPITLTSTITLANLTAATSSQNQSASPNVLSWQGAYWNGSASANDSWLVSPTLGTGTNPVSTLQFTHVGSSGGALVQIGGNLQLYSSNSIYATLPALRADNAGNIVLSATGSGSVFLAYDTGTTGGVKFGNGAFGVVASMSPAGSLSLNGALFTGSTIQGTNGLAATASANQAAPSLVLQSNIWTGSASAADNWQFITTLGTGANPYVNLNINHYGGSTGVATLVLGTAVLFSYPASIAFGSNWTTWTPTVTCTGSMTVSVTSINARYLRVGPILFFYLAAVVTLGGTLSNAVLFSTPTTPNNASGVYPASGAITGGAATFNSSFMYTNGSANLIYAYLSTAVNFPSAGSYTFYISGSYQAA